MMIANGKEDACEVAPPLSGKLNDSKESVFVFGVDSTDYLSVAYSDLAYADDVYIIPYAKGFTAQIRRVHFSQKLNRFVSLPFQAYWAERDVTHLREFPLSPFIILVLETKEAKSPAYISFLRSRYPNAFLCLNLLNPTSWKNTLQWVKKVERYYDLIITCSQDDASRFGWLYWPDCYAPIAYDEASHPSTDICFIAQGKGRVKRAWEIFSAATAHGFVCDFIIVGKEERPYESVEGFVFRKNPMSYLEYLEHVKRAKCLLEITADSSNHCTLRTMEAIAYGKILATTNASIDSESFFDERQICILSDDEKMQSLFSMLEDYKGPFDRKTNPFSSTALIEHLQEVASGGLKQ